MPLIVRYDDGLNKNGHTFTLQECSEVYNALNDRVSALEAALLPELPERTRQALTESLARCKKLVEVFE